MGFVHGKSSRVLLDDAAFSGFLRSWEAGSEREMADTTVLTDEGHRFLPGLDNGTVSFDGLFDDTVTAGGQDETLNSAQGAAAASVITLAPDGFALGKRVRSCEARENNFAYASPVADVVSFQAAWQSEGAVDSGVALHDLTAETTTANGSSNDGAASSANGGVGVLHVTANSRTANSTIKVQHSADNSTWADLVTFTAVGSAATTAERSAVTGTVNRYLRATWAPGGATGSITFVVAFCRR